MTVRFIASAVIAALLLIGFVPSASQTPETGITPIKVYDPVASVPEQTTPLTAEEAEAIALTHAGLTAAEVSGLRSHRDREDGIDHWDVEFFADQWEYDYEIGMDGRLLDWDKDFEGSHKPKDAPAANANQINKPSPEAAPKTAPTGSGKVDAKTIALRHAGLTASQVRELKVERDYENGVAVYDVEFKWGGYEYEYEIDANSGKIRKWDKEWDD